MVLAQTCYSSDMTPNHAQELEQFVNAQHGGPVQLDGTEVVVMSVDAYRDLMGVGTESELQQSLAAIRRGWQAAQQGRSRNFRDALDDLGRKYEAPS